MLPMDMERGSTSRRSGEPVGACLPIATVVSIVQERTSSISSLDLFALVKSVCSNWRDCPVLRSEDCNERCPRAREACQSISRQSPYLKYGFFLR